VEGIGTIVFAGGGTGGHVFPALCVADELRRRHPKTPIGFVGARRGMERRLVPQAGYPLRLLPLSGLKGRGSLARAGAAVQAGLAVARCAGWMVASRPELVVGVGGYASGPAVVAARALRVKTMVMEQNHFPGATNRWLAPKVDAVCVPSEDARRRLSGLGVVTGNPVRPEFAGIGDPPAGPALSLLAFGGSRGARSINRAMLEALPALAALRPAPRIVHQTGGDDITDARAVYDRHADRSFEALPFIDDMPARLAAADLVVCRAGASTLAELTAAGRPAILVPYPYAADDHQRHNAETLARAGAALVVSDDELDGSRLAALVTELASDPERLRAMGRAARSLGRPEATQRIADVADRLLAGEDADVP
jgi:UDP-N-acetylglucosamine--N-acetylmuramyl-(pentapeptide) pyrophosphoryl-undecaprenol N-acetylglucosamine transferase